MTADNKWVVGEKVIEINDQTNINGIAAVGAYASADVVLQPDGTLIGENIVVQQDKTQNVENKTNSTSTHNKSDDKEAKKDAPRTNKPVVRTYSGIIGRMSNTEWIVGSRSITINSSTIIEGNAGAGLPVRVTILVQKRRYFAGTGHCCSECCRICGRQR